MMRKIGGLNRLEGGLEGHPPSRPAEDFQYAQALGRDAVWKCSST
jgi:hypothetical protein